MFDVSERDQLRARLVTAARGDSDVEGVALVGSAARGSEDRWSDIDLALLLTLGSDPEEVAQRWTRQLQRDEAVIDHLDVHASGALYRVFLLRSTLQLDLSFWPHGSFVTGGAPVRVLFGQPIEPIESAESAGAGVVEDAMAQVRMAWLYALHARSALARGRGWQVLWMLEGIRNQLVSLYCLRYGLPTHQGRGVDQMPDAVRAELARTLVASTDPDGLGDTFGVLVDLLLEEADRQDLPLPPGLPQALDELVSSGLRAGPGGSRSDQSERV
jgi:predicted nucleotidyltransferase